ncbi:hypothetical protein BD311DRAFT_829949 [Dichomitus squalens]|uniref:Uncharacterized protein n=1 Tax=Dichomitus squalens TaxID=114155 RepID=A0A4V2JYM8_9APHY|nr:hypothetical protein BD311DRAFT_829949 [Dichomitus squalens]
MPSSATLAARQASAIVPPSSVDEAYTMRTVELAAFNADPNNWSWDERERCSWTPASATWQAFTAKWRNPTTPSVTETPDLSDIADISSSPLFLDNVLVRDCYLEAENVLWRRAVSPGGKDGVIFIGQPGTDKQFFSSR